MSVYDDEKEKVAQNEGQHDDLGVDPERREAESENLERSYNAPSATKKNNDVSSPESLAHQETSAGEGVKGSSPESKEKSALGESESIIGGGFKTDDTTRIGKIINVAVKGGKGKKAALGGGLIGGLITFIILAFFALLPLKINHIVENLQNRFFASSESAVSRRTEYLFSRYIKKHVLPSLNKAGCNKTTKTISKDCINPIEGETPAAKLFRGWRDARFENKLADNYGLEFVRNQNGYTLKMRGIPDTAIGDGFLTDSVELRDLTSGEFRQQSKAALDKALEGETRLKRVMYRFKFGRLADGKYGIERCVFACKGRDSVRDWKVEKKKAAQMMIVRRVIEPHTDSLGLALSCLLSGECDDVPATQGDNDTQRRDKLERQIREYLAKRGAQYTEDTVEKITQETIAIIDKGFSQYLIEKLTNETVAKVSSKAIPIVGWIDFGAQTINIASDAGPKLRRWAFVVNATAMASFYMMYRSHADELKSGNVDAELVGSMVNTLGDTAGDKARQGQPAEISPLYGELLGTSSTTTSLLDVFSPTAYAATGDTTAPPKYTCDNGNPIASGKLICPEESLITSNFLTTISDAFNSPPLNLLSGAAAVWKNTVGGFINTVLGLLGSALDDGLSAIPGYNSLKDQFAVWSQSLLEAVAKWLIPSPISPDMSGARAFNMMAGGADVAGNDFAHYGLGGRQLSNAEVAQIRNEHNENIKAQFAQKSWFGRMFDKEDSNSMVAHAAMALPTSVSAGAQKSVASLFRNPMDSMSKAFGALFASPRLYAATGDDPFGIPQYGYPLDDPALTVDPDSLTDQYCATFNKQWAESVQIDETTGMDSHATLNPCLLDQATVGSAGGYFTTDVLTSEDIGPGGTQQTTPPPTTAGQAIVGDIGESSDSVACAADTTDLGVVTSKYAGNVKKTSGPLLLRLCQLSSIGGRGNNTNGTLINGGAVVNSRVSGAWQALGSASKAAGVPLTASSSFRLADSCQGTGNGSRCARPGQSLHQLGIAIDFIGNIKEIYGASTQSCVGRGRDLSSPAWNWLFVNAEQFGFKQYSYEAWHWDSLNSPSRCGSTQ